METSVVGLSSIDQLVLGSGRKASDDCGYSTLCPRLDFTVSVCSLCNQDRLVLVVDLSDWI